MGSRKGSFSTVTKLWNKEIKSQTDLGASHLVSPSLDAEEAYFSDPVEAAPSAADNAHSSRSKSFSSHRKTHEESDDGTHYISTRLKTLFKAPSEYDEAIEESTEKLATETEGVTLLGNSLLLYPNHTHKHKLRKRRVDKGNSLLSNILRPVDKSKESANEAFFSIFSEASELELLQELRANKAKNEAYHREVSDDNVSTNSEPLITNPAIGRPQLELINKLVKIMENPTTSKNTTMLAQEYGSVLGICGKGSYGLVKIVCKTDEKTQTRRCFAVKEIKRKAREETTHFSHRLISEFIISLSLNHVNVVKIYDLMRNSRGTYSEIFEYCEAGDLYSIIAESKGKGLILIEADCFFKQILDGVTFMHSKGIAHCDLKPENILLTLQGCCKITDFGTSVVFKTAWEEDIHLSKGLYGSGPYAPPEIYGDDYYDPRLVDVWSLGVIYMVMRLGTFMWQSAEEEDELFNKFLRERPIEDDNGFTAGKFAPIENFIKDDEAVEVNESKIETLYDILEPASEERVTTLDIYDTLWVGEIKGCLRE